MYTYIYIYICIYVYIPIYIFIDIYRESETMPDRPYRPDGGELGSCELGAGEGAGGLGLGSEELGAGECSQAGREGARTRAGRTGPLCEVQFFLCGSWEGLDPGSWILDPGSWRPGSWILDPGFRTLDRGSWILFWILDPGSWILSWILDPGP